MTRTYRTLALTLLVVGLTGARGYAADSDQASDPKEGKRPVRVVIYPLLVQAPIFGASVDLPSRPGGGDSESGAVSGSTDVALNAAYMAGFLVETDRFLVEANGTYADVSADRQSPRIGVKSNTWLVAGRAGVRFWKDFWATAGLHHISTDLDVTITLPAIDRTIEGHVKPSLNDPMIGAAWRPRVGRWNLDASFEGGGFGVGTDVDLTGGLQADYRLGHFDLRLGYQIVHYKFTVENVNIGKYSRELVSTQTLHGPSIGFGIVF